MRKLLLFVVAFLFVATNINAEKLSGTLSSNMDAYTTWNESYPLTNANDGSYSTKFWSDAAQQVGEYVAMSFEEEKSIQEIVFHFADGDRPVGAAVEVSVDNSEWDTVTTFSTTDITTEGTYTCDAQGAMAKYVRLRITTGTSNWFQLVEFEVYEAMVNLTPRTITVSVNDASMGSAYIGEEGTTEVIGQTGIVRLTAVPAAGYKFLNWTYEGEEVADTEVLIDKTEGDKTYVANFAPLQLFSISVSVSDAIMGTAQSTETGEVYENTEITLSATPVDGYEFVNWTVGETIVSTQNPYVTIVEASADYKANFQVKPQKLELTDADISMEYYSSYYDSNIIDGDYNTFYDSRNHQSAGATVTVTLAEESYIGKVKIHFISRTYVPKKAIIQVSADNEIWTDVEGSEFFGSDIDSELAIAINTNNVMAKYVRMYIQEANSAYLTIAEFEVYETLVNVAPRAISVSVNDEAKGIAYIGLEGITEVENQTSAVKLIAEPKDISYKFVNWTVGTEEVSTSPIFVDRTEGSKDYVANFIDKPYFSITATTSDASKGEVSLSIPEGSAIATGEVYEGEEVTFTATSKDGYKFVAWKSGEEIVSESASYTIVVSEAVSLVATFERDPKLNRSSWTITASSQESSGEGAGNGVASCIIDGNTSTYWHSQWSGSQPGYPHWFMIDMKEVKSFDEFEYISRGTGTSDDGANNGNIVNYRLYVSNTEIDPENLDAASKVTEGTFTYDGTSNSHKVSFTAAKGRYVMLYATGQSANGRVNAACVEFYLYSSSYPVTVSSSDPELGTAYIGEEGVTAVGCSVEGTDMVTITAKPAPAYRFVSWMLNGEVVSNDAVYTTTAVTEARNYVANFEFAPVAPRTVKVSSNDKTKGYAVFVSPLPEGTASDVTSDGIVTVEAISQSSDDFFVKWTIDGVTVGTEPTYKYLGAEDVTIQANFISKYAITINQVAGGTISVKSGGAFVASGDRVLEGNYITLDVTENTGNQLKKLFINGEDVFIKYRYNPDYCVQVNEPITITAEFGEPICTFTYECTGNGWVEAWETDTYDEVADEEGTLELPLSPVGEQYAYGEAIPFGGTAAIFAVAGAGESLQSLTINGEEIDITEESDYAIYGDYFFDTVDRPIHVVAVFTGVTDGIESAEANEASIYAVASGVKVEVIDVTTVSVYSIAGTLVAEQQVSEAAVIALAKGVYIVKASDKVVKVVVK